MSLSWQTIQPTLRGLSKIRFLTGTTTECLLHTTILKHTSTTAGFTHLTPYLSKLSRTLTTLNSKTNDRNTVRKPSVRDILPSPQDGPDVFGTLSIGSTSLSVKDEIGVAANAELRHLASEAESIYTPDETDDHVFYAEHRWTMDRLRRTVFQLLNENNLKAALDTFLEVVQDGGFHMPPKDLSFICSALICACGRSGNVEMGFLLFEKMKRRGIGIKEAWYTSLLNACANSPWDSEKNLLRIESLRSHMSYKGYEPNQTHYHAMIKAYGRCGAIQSAFSIVDEMRLQLTENKDSNAELRITAETFNFLLQACITDKENGYRHAVVTWDKMLKMKIKPDFYSYKLFLRAIRECSIQLPKVMTVKPVPNLTSGGVDETQLLPVKTSIPEVIQATRGSLKHNVGIIELLSVGDPDSLQKIDKEVFPLVGRSRSELQTLLNVPENRFALLGGLRAFTVQMDIHKVRLDVKSATELVQNVSTAEVPDVLMLLEERKLIPDIHFFNMVIQKYMRWRQVKLGKKVLEQFSNYNLTPNIMTWGILALGAETWKDCTQLLREMDALAIIPNDQIMSAFLLNACQKYDPRYIIRLLEEHVRREITPSSRFIEAVLDFKENVHKAIVDVERGKEVKPFRLNAIIRNAEFTEYWQKLQLRVEGWVRQVGVKEEEIPWKRDTRERVERLKNRRLEPA